MRRRKRVAWCLVISLLMGMMTPVTAKSTTSVNYKSIIQEESEYLVNLQLDNGCYPMTSYQEAEDGRVQMSPYFAEFTALALLESGETYLDSVQKYLDYHFDHLNTSEEDVNNLAGTIYDYWEYVDTSSNHVEKEIVFTQDGAKFYDSTDSYAALFLKVLSKYSQVSGNTTYLTEHKDQIDEQIAVLKATMRDGLSIATPSYDVQYLMDNAEVYGGLTAGISLYQKVFPTDTTHIKTMQTMRATIKKQMVKKMYHTQKGGYFDSALEQQESGEFTSPSFHWKTFYMDATSQIFLVTNGVFSPTSQKAKTLYKNFNKYWCTSKAGHNWTKMDYSDEYYWGELVLGAAMMKDKTRVNAYLTTYEKKVHSNDHGYPLYNGDAAKVIRACYKML